MVRPVLTLLREGSAARVWLDGFGPWALPCLLVVGSASSVLPVLLGLLGMLLSSLLTPILLGFKAIVIVQLSWAAVTLVFSRRAGASIWNAIADGLGVVVPRAVASFAVLEIRAWLGLVAAPLRLAALSLQVRHGAQVFRYRWRPPVRGSCARLVADIPALLLLVHLLGAGTEGALVSLVVLVFFMLVGNPVATIACPHVMRAGVIHARSGFTTSIRIPLWMISHADTYQPPEGSWAAVFGVVIGQDWAAVAAADIVSRPARVYPRGAARWARLHLLHPVEMRTWSGRSVPVGLLHLEMDDPSQFVRVLSDLGIARRIPIEDEVDRIDES